MNVNDFEARELEGDLLHGIFKLQDELHDKYMPIEFKNGTGFAIVQDRPFDINDRYWQAMCKDMSHRVIEELTESYEAYQFHIANTEHPLHFTHVVEELIDALHFMTEYLIVVGIKPESLLTSEKVGDSLSCLWHSCHVPEVEAMSDCYWRITLQLGTATNLLKLRPWKSTHMVTDIERYHNWLRQAYRSLIMLIKKQGLNHIEIYELYTKKNSVNEWRIGSGY